MSSRHGTQRRESRKLTKNRKPTRASSVQYPERLREGDDDHEDVATTNGNPGQSVHQSVFSMITKAGSTTDFHKRFDEESSDSEEEPLEKTSTTLMKEDHILEGTDAAKDDASTLSQPVRSPNNEPHGDRAVPQLYVQTIGEEDPMSQSMFLPPKQACSIYESPKGKSPQDAPVMSQMLEAQADLSPSGESSEAKDTRSEDALKEDFKDSTKDLAGHLKMIFGFEHPEEVIAEYPCWLTQSVLLQGYMYITQKHICFYAYAPKRSNTVVKSGHLSKRGKQNPKFSRYWFQLKGDELSYRTDPSDPYFRSGNIDLRYGISASLHESKDKNKSGCKDFSIITPQREYSLKADSAASAKEWVKQLQRVIFRSHNKGDSVKISMPIENVVDIEEAPVMDVAETIKVRVADADEGFAVFAVDEVLRKLMYRLL